MNRMTTVLCASALLLVGSSAALRAASTPPQAPVCLQVNGPAGASCTNASGSANCLAYQMATADALFASSHRVFAHYIDVLPLSLDNKPAASDYYSQVWLAPVVGNMWYPNGGFLRSRPLPTVPSAAAGFQLINDETEVRTALARGVTGFTYDIGSAQEVAAGGNLLKMLQAAAAVDPRFSIVLMVDHLSVSDVETVVKAVRANASVFRISNKIVLAPYMADTLPPSAWAQVKSDLASAGIPIFFLPTFLSLQSTLAQYVPVADGIGLFGTAISTEGQSETQNTLDVHNAGKPYMSGISPQGYRPKSFVFWETDGSQGYRGGWDAAISQGADWVQLTTWNDFSESTQVAPYTNQLGYPGTGFYDLTGYFASWFATQQQPSISHDVLYYFYRREPVAAAAPSAAQATVSAVAGQPGDDLTELVAFLTKPATLSITIGSTSVTRAVAAGLQVLTAPLAPGQPQFSLIRNGTTQISVTGVPVIEGPAGLPNGFSDLTYWSGSGSSVASCSSNG